MRAVLLSALLLLGSVAAAEGAAVASSAAGMVTVSSYARQPLASFLVALGKSQSLDVVPVGVPSVEVAYTFTNRPFASVWSMLTAAHGLVSCEKDGVMIVGPASALTSACGLVSPPASTTVQPAAAVSSETTPTVRAAPPARVALRLRVLEIADNSQAGGGVDWEKGLLPSVLAGVAALVSGAPGVVSPSALTNSISALEREGLARKLDDVRLVVTEGKTASFQSGGTLQLSLIGGGEATIQRQLPYGLNLSFDVARDGDEAYSVGVVGDISSPVSTQNVSLLDMSRRGVSTNVSVRPGAAVVVASWGAVRDEASGSGLPGAARVPVVGYLAGRASSGSSRSTVVVTLEVEAVS